MSHASFAIDHFTSTVHKFQLANPPKCESLWEFSRFERPEALSSQKVSVILFPTNRTKGRPLPTLRLSVSEQRRTWCDQATYCIYRRSTCHGKQKGPRSSVALKLTELLWKVLCGREHCPLHHWWAGNGLWRRVFDCIHFISLAIPSILLFPGIYIARQSIPPHGAIGIGILPYSKSFLSQYISIYAPVSCRCQTLPGSKCYPQTGQDWSFPTFTLYDHDRHMPMKIDRTALYLFGLVARLVPNDSDSTGANNCDSMNQS